MEMTVDNSIFGAAQTDASQITLAMLRNSADCVKLLNTAGRISFMSENGMCAMQIDTPDMVVGKTWWDLWPQEARATLQASFETALKGEDTTMTGACPTAKGEPREWHVTLTPVKDAAGTVQSVLAVSRDVTA